jgi:hypothetical protein
MERKVNFAQYQQVSTANLNNMQTNAEQSLDNIVSDTLVSTRGFTGFAASKTGPAQVTVLAGRLYVAGKVYALDTPTQHDSTAQLPVAAKRIAIIAGWGSEADADVGAVNFLIAAQSTPQNPVYQPQVVAKTLVRAANLGMTLGTEAPDPSAPIVDATLLQIARVVLTPTGVDSVTMIAANEAPNLEDVEGRTAALEAWVAVAAPELTSLSATISQLSNALRNSASQATIGRMLGRIAVLEAKDGVPSNAADSSADFFLDPATSDLAHPISLCKVQEGVRFGDDGAADAALQLFNPLDPLAKIANGVLFPAYDPILRFATGTVTGEAQISQYTYQTQTLVQKTMSRQRVRYGNEFTVCTNGQFWQRGTYDPLTQIFKLPNGETFKAAFDPTLGGFGLAWVDGLSHFAVRLQEMWTDTVSEPYWDRVTTNSQINGSQVAETFPTGQDFWLHSVDLQFTKIDANGAVTVALCGATDVGFVDVNNVLAQVTIAQAALQAAPARTPFVFDKPVYLQAGKRYGIAVISTGNHSIATTDGTSFPSGMFFGLVGGTEIADPTKHIWAEFNACKFRQTVTTIQLQPLQLAGGITSIDILSGAIAPGSTQLTYQVQVAGQWISLAAANTGALNAGGNLPPLLPFRAVFSGTPDVMPCLDLLNSNVHVSRPRINYVHLWPKNGRTPPAATSQIRLTERYESFDANFHTTQRRLLTGASFATETAPSSTTDVTTADGALERTYVWNLVAAVTAFQFKGLGNTTTALKTFHAAWIKDWVL